MNSTQSEFCSYIKNKKTAVVGLGISNTPLAYFLLRLGAEVTVRDSMTEEQLGDVAKELKKAGAKFICGEHYLENRTEEIIFKAPGIRYDLPFFEEARKQGAVVTSEMELFFDLCPCKIIGITGSDGKTTTTTLVGKILKEAGKKVYVGGNIGVPLLSDVFDMSEKDFAVVELSSFQLHTMKKSPDVAIITNITPNHLNFHTDMNEYIEAKKNIYRFNDKVKLILNYENEETRKIGKENEKQTCFFSSYSDASKEAAIVLENGQILHRGTPILSASEIKIPGRHNIENYMAAILATEDYVLPEHIRKVAVTFGGVEHRIELVRELDGVKYYNSSIDSTPARTEAALKCFPEKVIAICGGYDKNIPFEPLAKTLCEHTKKVILTGATAEKIYNALTNSEFYHPGNPEIYCISDFSEAVKKAKLCAEKGDVVILSPACASFDAFKNFEARGNTFKKIVNQF